METNFLLNQIRNEICSKTDEAYKEFQGKLLPNTPNYMGVRLPELRKLAKKITKTCENEYLEAALYCKAEDELFEEIMLQGMVIGYSSADISDLFIYIRRFLPKIDNWAVCDSFCSGLKQANRYPKEVWDFLQEFLESKEEFEIRFGVVMLLFYYINDAYVTKLFSIFDKIIKDTYYVKMAVAWAISICYIKYPTLCMEYLKQNKLDDFTYNKAIQKIVESRCVAQEEKEALKKMKK